MTSEELKKAAWEIIDKSQDKISTNEEDGANAVLKNALVLIQDATSKRLHSVVIHALNKSSTNSLNQHRLRKVTLGGGTRASGEREKNRMDEDEKYLQGLDLIVYKKCREAGLAPRIIYEDMATNRLAIMIQW